MGAKILKEERMGWPAQHRPDRKLPDPWTPELLVSVNHIHHHTLSPDGQFIVFVWVREGKSDLWLISADGSGWPQRLTFDRPVQTFWSDSQPRWSPDGSWLVYVAGDDIWVVPARGGKARQLTDFQHGDSSPIFSPDGKRIYFLSGRKDYLNLCWTDLEGSWPISLTDFEADVSDPQPSPDGSKIAFVYHPQEDLNRSEICLVAAQGGQIAHLTGAPKVWDVQPRWSPDGKRIAFLSNRSGWCELYLLEVDTGVVQQVTSAEVDIQSYNWNRDGNRIVLVVNREGSADLYLLDLNNADLRPLREAKGWHSLPQWSPEGDFISFEYESPTNPPDIYRLDLKTGKSLQLTCSLPPTLATCKMVHPEFVRYPGASGSSIPGFLFRPLSASPGQPCPAIVYPHGGPTDEHALYWDMLAQWLLAKGYAVLAPNYRGSTGYGVSHQHALHNNWGIVDTEDMLSAADYLVGLDWVDSQRMGIYGASYGSYLAVLALARDPKYRFKCGVAKFGDCDILASWAQGDRTGKEDLERQMGHPTQNRTGYRAGTPVYDVTKIQAPLLIFHGAEDKRVHPKQSEQLVEALKGEKKSFEYILYEGEGHGFLQEANVLHFYATLERFLDWYLL